MKNADKIWRVTPAGIDIIMDWFGLNSLESMATTDEVKATLR